VSRALAGWSVLVTRAAEQAGTLAGRLEEHGARVHVVPVVTIAPPLDESPLREALAQPQRFDWVLFTSQNAVGAVARLVPPQTLAPCKVGAVGRATAAALEAYGVRVDLVPEASTADHLLQALIERDPDLASHSFLLPRAADGRDVLPHGLRARGAAVTLVEAYRTVPSVEHRDELIALLKDGAVDAVTFTAASAVRAFDDLLDEELLRVVRPGVPVFCLGPIVLEAARALGYNVQPLGPSFDIDGLIQSMLQAAVALPRRHASS
jgi:uroporphyrinogen-III synthase